MLVAKDSAFFVEAPYVDFILFSDAPTCFLDRKIHVQENNYHIPVFQEFLDLELVHLQARNGPKELRDRFTANPVLKPGNAGPRRRVITLDLGGEMLKNCFYITAAERLV